MHSTSKMPETSNELMQFIGRQQSLGQIADFSPIPAILPGKDSKQFDWIPMGEAVLFRLHGDSFPAGVLAYARMGDAYRAGDAAAFNGALADYEKVLLTQVPKEVSHARYERQFNRIQPFTKSMVLYLLVFLLAVISWMWIPNVLQKSAFSLLVAAFIVHSLGLISRVVLQGRPPVTNLYSSAVFVGWGSVLLGIILERLHRKGVASMVAASIGFITLIIAHHLGSQGDTMEMMQAVLDSNFWLATHVVTITIGYSATFIAGFLAVAYLVGRLWKRDWNLESAQSLAGMVYGIVCFATFFSFLGTVLGGIWADQSWGRFWGWDPKENGALLIVLWNAVILHAWWRKFVSETAIMMMAVFGNIVTALSWFGVNMLGVGLHSYGFMDKALVWLTLFSLTQVIIILLGFVKPKPRLP